jgi:anti-sigma factor ChrR (cupin superfamily)
MRFMPSCHEVQSELTEYAEGALPFTRRAAIWLHLRLCQVCAGFLRGLKAMPGMAKASLAPPADVPEAAASALAQVQAAIRKAKAP